FNTRIVLQIYPHDEGAWLSQANHVFSRLQITSRSNLKDYMRIEAIYFIITIESAPVDPPAGFLFICPREDFRTRSTSFSWPKCPAYWSLDPDGIEVLSVEKAARLGFPAFQLATKIKRMFWDASVYDGLRRFHKAKGFDPESQDVARNLGYPLYKLCRDVNPEFAHLDDFDEAEVTTEEL
ncbi:hypothetical protein B0H16DRAFT_1763294, partial [Mycena metata]